MKHTWDIFCSVVDNFGDIGVCWRLARQLASAMGQPVRLWVDDLASFQRICRAVDPARAVQSVEAVEVRRWSAPFPAVEPASIVVEGFGVKLPDNYVAAMAARTPRPVWVNLEHLSAERWVDGCHGLPSPHPTLPLTKHFFFPGFTAATGGLLIEREFAQARDAFQSDAGARARFWKSLGLMPSDDDELRVSLFCYQNAALPALTAAWAAGAQPVTCVVPAGAALDQLAAVLGTRLEPGTGAARGRLQIAAIPFLDVDRYDRLLWACDVNFVRGEDSFVRAQLAARPLVWQAYVQSEDSHIAKQAAFLDRYVEGVDGATAAALRAVHEAWNRQSPGIAQCWGAFLDARAAAAAHARDWAARLVRGGSLAIKLAEFCQDRLE
jgi:uncharacterized repeat protein (TIGR03837 family)